MSFFTFLLPRPDSLRPQWVRQQLRQLPPGTKLLDAGCGPQPYRRECAHLTYVAQDFGAYDGAGDGTGLHDGGKWNYGKLDYTCDLWAIPAKSKSFDAILCTEVLEHVPYPVESLREFARLLKTGGTLILTAPVNCIPHQTPYFFYHGIARQLYEKVGMEEGLQLIQFSTYPSPAQFVFMEAMRHAATHKPWVRYLAYAYLLPLGFYAWLTRTVPGTVEAYPAAGALILMRKV